MNCVLPDFVHINLKNVICLVNKDKRNQRADLNQNLEKKSVNQKFKPMLSQMREPIFISNENWQKYNHERVTKTSKT